MVPAGVPLPVEVAGTDVADPVGVGLGTGVPVVGPLSSVGVGLVAGRGRGSAGWALVSMPGSRASPTLSPATATAELPAFHSIRDRRRDRMPWCSRCRCAGS
ncbi:hypothetical protein [Streptomyces sp. CA-179760]|uniref:hypothetical protein n=1 Tax=Streptomyces sp. CA-179760 TaxID=3240054 RepID=UPI003D8B94B7